MRRVDFVAARRGKQARGALFSVQAFRRPDGLADPHKARIGLTVTRKVGPATVRNRIKRRLRGAIAHDQGLGFRAGYDYVLIARTRAANAPFAALTEALRQALETVHKERPRGG
ncbi:MAG: ribonuclease P protein component [Devosiaceae bacterium]|nr:ribonuclease P protein component [Devosiaceae bacterium MH13]